MGPFSRKGAPEGCPSAENQRKRARMTLRLGPTGTGRAVAFIKLEGGFPPEGTRLNESAQSGCA